MTDTQLVQPAPRGPLARKPWIVPFVVAFLLLGLAWVASVPTSGAVDEPAHYVKALATANGDLFGKPATWHDTPLPPNAQAAFDGTTRRFRVPKQLAPKDNMFPCFAIKPNQPATCRAGPSSVGPIDNVSYTGIYPPLPYVAPGLASRLARTSRAGLHLARLANGLSCLALLGLAFAGFLTGERGDRWLVAGFLLALTPTALSLAFSMNPNGTEICAGLAFTALAFAALRPGAPEWTWWAVGGVGFFLGASRPLSFAWIGTGLVGPLLIPPLGRLIAHVRANARRAAIALALVAGGALFSIGWDVIAGASTQRDTVGVRALIGPMLRSLKEQLHEQIGVFGWEDVKVPSGLFHLWVAAIVVLVVAALIAGTWQQRFTLALLGVVYVGVAVGMGVIAHSGGFPPYGRYVLVPLTAIPLAAGEILRLRVPHFRRAAHGAVVGAVGVVVVGHGVALLTSGRRFAVGVHGPLHFVLSGAAWNPAISWPGVTVISLAGLVVLASLAVIPARAGRGPARPVVQPEEPHVVDEPAWTRV